MFEMDNIPYWGFVSFGVLIVLLVIGIIFLGSMSALQQSNLLLEPV